MDPAPQNIPPYVEELLRCGTPSQKTSKAEIKFVRPSFEINSLTAQMNEENISIHVLKMKNSLLIWIGKMAHPEFYDLALALTDSQQNVTTTKIVGSSLNTISVNLANKLSKKLNKVVYVSCNLQLDLMTIPFIEKCIADAIKTNPEIF